MLEPAKGRFYSQLLNFVGQGVCFFVSQGPKGGSAVRLSEPAAFSPMALTLRDITWASLSETRNNRDKIAVSASERRTYVPKVSAVRLTRVYNFSA